jgi:cation:H+ antiporter
MRLTAFFMLLCTAAWIAITLFYGLDALVGLGFLIVLAGYAMVAWFINRKDRSEDTPEEKKLMDTPAWRMIMLILIGLVGLPLGSKLLVDGGISLAEETGLSKETVGLTLLAVGSSLPELSAGVAAAVRKQSDIAMGNILGSNIFNILGVGGVVAFLAPQPSLAEAFTGYSNWAMGLAAILVTLVVFLHRRVGWLTGAFFLALYAAYIVGLVQAWSLDSIQDYFIVPGDRASAQ